MQFKNPGFSSILSSLIAIFLCSLLLACGAEPTPQVTPTASLNPGPTRTARAENAVIAPKQTPNLADPLIADRLARQQAALQLTPPVLTLTEGLDENQKLAQELAIQDAQLQNFMYAPGTKQALRSEIFGIYPLRESDFTPKTNGCRQSSCYRVELYSYAYNFMLATIVDVKNRKVLATTQQIGSQPDIPEHLKKLAVQIATTAPVVEQVLGYKPTSEQALMANTKTALNRTTCERSLHLCVAPTFVYGDEALWAIVDLTDLTLVGTQWTQVGQSSQLPVSEKNLQDMLVTKQFCEKTTPVSRNGWQMDYILTSSDGLRLANVSFNNRPIIRNVKLVDWHVSYSQRQGFGYSDAVGCPVFSQAAVVAVGGPKTEALGDNGFVLIQDFWSVGWPAPCNYYYQQRYEFYNDGRFRVSVASLGRGCGNSGTYRPVTRIAWAGTNSFAEWDGTAWQPWATEKWQAQTPQTSYTPQNYQYRIRDGQGQGYYLEPGKGQFGDGGRGDNAFVYVTRHHPDKDEGESDLTTIGPCCNTDYRQGPEKFIEPNPEPITDTELVVWYVAQLKNDDTPGHEYCWAQSVVEKGLLKINQFPCYSGPMFTPIKPGQD